MPQLRPDAAKKNKENKEIFFKTLKYSQLLCKNSCIKFIFLTNSYSESQKHFLKVNMHVKGNPPTWVNGKENLSVRNDLRNQVVFQILQVVQVFFFFFFTNENVLGFSIGQMRADLCCMNLTGMVGNRKISLHSALMAGVWIILNCISWLLHSLETTHLIQLLHGSDKEVEVK